MPSFRCTSTVSSNLAFALFLSMATASFTVYFFVRSRPFFRFSILLPIVFSPRGAKTMGKRIENLKKGLDLTKKYTVKEAVAMLKKSANAKFDETVEVHLKLGIDVKQSDQ